jgi:hypothetical protein
MSETYGWQNAYSAAILETDNAAMPLRIFEALSAIGHRLELPIEPACEEMRQIERAQIGLQALMSERTNQFEAQ